MAGVNWVPAALIRQVCYPTGRKRLPKLTRLEFPEGKPATRNPSYPAVGTNPVYSGAYVSPYQIGSRRTSMLALPAGPSATKILPVKGNLPNDLYRFFIGCPDETALTCTCRWCNVSLSKTLVRDHLKEKGNVCKEKILEALRSLRLGDSQCSACERRTKSLTWGVPLCSVRCENLWKFHITTGFRFEKNQIIFEAASLTRKESAL